MLFLFLIIVLITPAFLVWFGLKWKRRAPERMSLIYGYRTKWSMKSRKTWDFAHHYIGRFWSVAGIVLGVVSEAVMLINSEAATGQQGIMSLILIAVQLLLVAVSIVPTELALRKNFDPNGIEIDRKF